ncbi:MAG: glycosyltransferase family 2 protein [Dysgonamonadaceae bacterium]|jgi:GT2 family glycosyltransferase|nr:glycosyltransferase family 2 protein [Dysgonamonadaceae bacterium]
MKQTVIVILSWNGKKLLEQFLPVLTACTPPEEADIVVADNGSTDDSLSFLEKHYPAIRVQRLERNYGFAEGYNRALAGLQYKYAVLLNSDVAVTENWFRSAIDYLEANGDVCALQPKILSYHHPSAFEYAGASGGFLDKHGYPFCRGRILNTIETDTGQYDTVQQVFWASGACLFIRLDDFREAGGFDSGFFAHQEEIDLCWRLNARGKKIVCLPQSCIYHVGAATLKKADPHKTYLNFRNNLLMLYKNLPGAYYRKVMLARFFWDYLSAFHFLLKGQLANAAAIPKARRDFILLKPEYKAERDRNLQLAAGGLPPAIYPESIIRQYYFKNKKKYQDLNNQS